MINPYINTELYTKVLLYPNQMDNNLYINLKKNLEEQLTGKCFKDYGYIMNVYEIIKYSHGIIEAENLSALAKFNVSFTCRLCKPLIMKDIICEVKKINKLMFTATNGPILVIVTTGRINDTIFFLDNNSNIRYKKDGKNMMLQESDHVIINIRNIKFDNGDKRINAIGHLRNIATDEDKKIYYEQLHNKSMDKIEYETFMKENSTINSEN